jgi:protein-S-isoprenylcysteine O-methyltransferase Ste14
MVSTGAARIVFVAAGLSRYVRTFNLCRQKEPKMNEPSSHAPVRVPPPLIGIVLLITGWLLQLAWPLNFLSSSMSHAIGVIVFVSGLPIAITAVICMRRNRTTVNPYRRTTALVCSGPFRFTRNPLYVAMILHYCGIAIFLRLPWALILAPIVVLIMTKWVIIPEETYLERLFGEEYDRYKSEVPRWM